MLSRTVKLCILALILTVVGTACKSTRPKVSPEHDTARAHIVQGSPLDESK
jgi:hypothetical protein